MIFNNLNLKKKDIYTIIIILLINLAIVIKTINFNFDLGIYCTDVYVYLLNSLYFAGENIRTTSSIYLSPSICFLTSILIKVGVDSKIAIYTITGAISIIGSIGLYLLFRIRFKTLLSFLGTILFTSFSLNLLWLSNGTLDIPAIGLTIWIVLLTIIAIDEDSKYFLILFPLLVFSFFTRFTVILIIPVLIIYYLMKKDLLSNINKKEKKELLKNYLKTKEFRHILIGILIAILLTSIYLISISIISSNLNFLNQGAIINSDSRGNPIDNAYNTDIWFYITNFPNFISSSKIIFNERIPILVNPNPFGYFLISILFIGALFGFYKLFKSKKLIKSKNTYLLILLSIISILTFNIISPIYTIILVLTSLLILDSILKDDKTKLYLMYLAWTLIYLIFFSYINIKVDRYIITIMPAINFFIVLSLKVILEKFNKNIQNIVPFLIILFCIFSAFNFTNTFDDGVSFKSDEDISNFLINYDENYKNKIIGSYNVRIHSFTLKKYVEAYPSNNESKIDISNLNYYISDEKLNLKNFKDIKNINNIYLYEKISV